MKSKWKYEIIIYWSEEDQAYIAEVPELPGCAADGKTYKQALANVEVIIREWIETPRSLSAASPNRKADSCTRRLTPDAAGLPPNIWES